MKRIENIFSASLLGGQEQVFSYQPASEGRLLGLLVSPEIELSLSFNGGTDLKVESFDSTTSLNVPPKSKIIPLDVELSMLKGKVKNRAAAQTKANVYLIQSE